MASDTGFQQIIALKLLCLWAYVLGYSINPTGHLYSVFFLEGLNMKNKCKNQILIRSNRYFSLRY